MVVNTETAHPKAQLTISWTLIVRENTNDEKYLNSYREYQTKAANLGKDIATAEEDADGFTFIAKLDLENGYQVPDTVTDNNYYPKDSKAKVIVYAETGKGFECKWHTISQ